MNSLRVAAFFPEDFERIEVAYQTEIGNLDLIMKMVNPRLSRTMFDGDRIMGSGGVVTFMPGVGFAWVLVDAWVVKEPVRTRELIRGVKTALKDIATDAPFHRIQADVRSDFEVGRKFARVLGFSHEGSMEAYDSFGNDYERFALVYRSLIGGE